MILRAKHRGSKFNSGGREVTCTLKDGTLFSWFNSGDNVLYSLVQPSEEMCTPEGTGTFKRGVMELQPGVLSTANGSIQPPEEEESRGLRQSWTEERHVPASFIIRAAAVGDATPILRYTLALDAPTKQKKRKRDSEGGNPTGPGSSSRRRSSTGGGANGGATAQPVAVNFCSEDGSLRVKSNLRYGFDCPFESCGMRCRSSITALQHHLMASHPYYEYFVTAGEAGPEVWVRCRRGKEERNKGKKIDFCVNKVDDLLFYVGMHGQCCIFFLHLIIIKNKKNPAKNISYNFSDLIFRLRSILNVNNFSNFSISF